MAHFLISSTVDALLERKEMLLSLEPNQWTIPRNFLYSSFRVGHEPETWWFMMVCGSWLTMNHHEPPDKELVCILFFSFFLGGALICSCRHCLHFHLFCYHQYTGACPEAAEQHYTSKYNIIAKYLSSSYPVLPQI